MCHGMEGLMDDQHWVTIRRQLMLLVLGVAIFTTALTLLWAELI